MQVAQQFVDKYYDVLEKCPAYLGRFYKEDSTFRVTEVLPNGEQTNPDSARGLEVGPASSP